MLLWQPLLLLLLSLHLCPTLCDPIDGSPLGSSVAGILQARTLEWVAISFSSAWKWKVKVKSLSRAWLLVTPWTAAYQAPLSMGFSKQEYWSGLPLPSLIAATNYALVFFQKIRVSAHSFNSQRLLACLWIVFSEQRFSLGIIFLDFFDGFFFLVPPVELKKGSSWYYIRDFFLNQCCTEQGQFSSVAQLYPTLCDCMDCSTSGFPVHHQLLELTQTHVHWVSDAIQPLVWSYI